MIHCYTHTTGISTTSAACEHQTETSNFISWEDILTVDCHVDYKAHGLHHSTVFSALVLPQRHEKIPKSWNLLIIKFLICFRDKFVTK